ncbi:MAG: O-antigen ligase family protein [Alphaproteobacteria bacterium]|nr:MAG: O-antigen ligase family protein [Alphaproteobacteria bacterium]
MIRRRYLKFPVETFKSIQLWVTITALTLAPLFFGSVDQLWVATWTILLAISTLCGLAAPMGIRQTRVMTGFLAVCFAYGLVAILQVVPHLIDQLDDPIWQRANDLLGFNTLPRISSRAEIPPVAIGHFLLLVTSFMSGFFVGTSHRNADLLIWFARYSILSYAAYGLVALVLTPNMLLWAPKVAYQGSLTATFVNHNTAATFIGAGAILWFCVGFASLQSFQYSSIRLLLLSPSNEKLAFNLMLRLAAALTCFLALLLTGSRGGLICSSLGLLAAIGLMIANKLRPRLWSILGWAGLALVVVAVWLSGAGRIGSHGLFDDGRWTVYGFCIEAIGQRPLLGAGAGTFADLFPSLRAADLSSWGVWDYAHSTILEMAVEMGIPIAAMVVIAAAASLFILVRAALRSKDRSQTSLAAITGIAVLSYLHSIIDFSLQIPGYLIVFGILLGCGLARASSEQTTVQRARSGTSNFREINRSSERPVSLT